MGLKVAPLISTLAMHDYGCGDRQASATGPDFYVMSVRDMAWLAWWGKEPKGPHGPVYWEIVHSKYLKFHCTHV